MLNFHYHNPARIFFGDGAEQNIYRLFKEYKVTSLMFVYSGDFVKTLGIWDVIKDACDRLDIDFLECGDVVPNPKIELIRDLVDVSKEHSVDFVLAAGGGKRSPLGFPTKGMCGISLTERLSWSMPFLSEPLRRSLRAAPRRLTPLLFQTD